MTILDHKTVLGIDPGGSSGGVIHLSVSGAILSFHKFKGLTDQEIHEVFKKLAIWNPYCFLEQVGGRKSDGANRAFNFGVNYGLIRAFLVTTRIPYQRLVPLKWQRLMSCLTGGDKNISKAEAMRLYPGYQFTHLNADAYLIAECGRRILTERQSNLKRSLS